jgi:hypothetical protein
MRATKVLALDLSTNTGWAVIDASSGSPAVVDKGNVTNKVKTVVGKYPYNYIDNANIIADAVLVLAADHQPSAIVIEETNKGKSRYTQKTLEFIHFAVLSRLRAKFGDQVFYVNTSNWRKSLNVQLSAADKKANQKLSRAKAKAKKDGIKLDKKALGIKGRITKKHLAVRVANSTFNLKLVQKDNDIAEAILLGLAYINDVEICNGT